jgi:hypothetical protein
MASPSAPNAELPHWVKISGIIGAIFVVLVIVMLLFGHNPGRHLRGATVPADNASTPVASP